MNSPVVMSIHVIAGKYQRIFYHRDRHTFFLNWIVIIDIHGYIVLSRPGFVGHIADSTCFR